ncbi:MAG: CvpA family protein [Patescibacteria group bacterium]
MNWVDLIIILAIGVFAADGIKRGFLIQAFNIVGFLFSLLFALALYAQLASVLLKIFNIPEIAANPISFLIIWIVAESAFFGVLTGIYAKFIARYHHIKINKYLGILPSIANALLFLAFVLLLVVSLPIRPGIKQDIFNSKFGAELVNKATLLEKPFNDIFGPITKQTLTFLTVKPEDKGSVDLKFTQKTVSVDYDAEKQMFALVNEERMKAGARPLVLRDNLAEVARAHSRDMFARGYFSHFSPESKDIGDRLGAADISYTYAGENLALAPSVQRAHTGLVNSEGHKRNILDPAFTKIGIGGIDGGIYGKMFTQIFTE